MTEAARKQCLLIMPLSFYSFAKLFGQALEDLGYEVVLANEEYPENALGKLLGKLDLPISRILTRRRIRSSFLAGKHYHLVVIVKGRGIGLELARELHQHSHRVVGYHFDSLSYDRATEGWARGVDRVSTFDYRDAKAKNWPLVELFSAVAPPVSAVAPTISFSTIMRNHSGRLKYLDEVTRALNLRPSDITAYIYEQDIRSLLFNFIRHPIIYWRWNRHIHRLPLPYEEYRRILESSDFTIDFAHPKQTGLTMRCFEALAAGAKIITNNSMIAESPYFESANAIIFERGGSAAELKRRVARLRGSRPHPVWRSARDCLVEIIGT